MAKLIAPLTELKVRNARKGENAYRMFDGGGLYLEVTPAGSKRWKIKFRVRGRESRATLGDYPAMSLAEARVQREQFRAGLKAGLSPAQARHAHVLDAGPSFESVAREWHENNLGRWQANTAQDKLRRLEHDIFSAIGPLRMRDLPPQAILAALRAVEARGALEVARRLAGDIANIYSYAYHAGHVDHNPARELVTILKPREPGHFAAINPSELPNFLAALDRNDAAMGPIVHAATRLMLLTFVRTAELTGTAWREIDFAAQCWVIPWQRMKMGRRKLNPCKKHHVVHLSRQAVRLLRELHDITGGGTLLFPNEHDGTRHMSGNAILAGLARMGYKGAHTGHGFRALAMTVLKESLRVRHEVVDRQLAHVPKDKTDAAYDRADYLEERREVMQAWADHLDRLRAAHATGRNLP